VLSGVVERDDGSAGTDLIVLVDLEGFVCSTEEVDLECFECSFELVVFPFNTFIAFEEIGERLRSVTSVVVFDLEILRIPRRILEFI
jgi:hypothetical protein